MDFTRARNELSTFRQAIQDGEDVDILYSPRTQVLAELYARRAKSEGYEVTHNLREQTYVCRKK